MSEAQLAEAQGEPSDVRRDESARALVQRDQAAVELFDDRVDETRTIDTRAHPQRGRRLKAEWLRVALERLESGVPGVFGYNLMAISRADPVRLREMHVAYFRSMQALVADSAPSECVVLFNTELFALDEPAKTPPS